MTSFLEFPEFKTKTKTEIKQLVSVLPTKRGRPYPKSAKGSEEAKTELRLIVLNDMYEHEEWLQKEQYFKSTL
jgi:hypothetical protein